MFSRTVLAALLLATVPAFAQRGPEQVDSDNACVSLTGHAGARKIDPQFMDLWIEQCSRNNLMDGLLCRTTRDYMATAGGPFKAYAARLKCMPDPKLR